MSKKGRAATIKRAKLVRSYNPNGMNKYYSGAKRPRFKNGRRKNSKRSRTFRRAQALRGYHQK